jgi:hypothetical protein
MMQARSTISDSYLAQQRELHKNPDYGIASSDSASLVKQLIDQAGVRSISDYGAGKCNLKRGLHQLGTTNFEYFPYDPAFPEYGAPRPAELVCCIDVLEHIEEPFLEAVLLDLKEITRHLGFFSVHTGAAAKTLPDGRNAHLIQKPTSWWLPQLCQHFEIGHLQRGLGGFWIVAEPRKSS